MAVASLTTTDTDMEAIITAVDTRADAIIDPDDPNRPTLEQRRVDALVSLALDTTVPSGERVGRGG
jgi:hypothetical protein